MWRRLVRPLLASRVSNPLSNILALADVEVVVKDGRIYKGGSAPLRTNSSDAR